MKRILAVATSLLAYATIFAAVELKEGDWLLVLDDANQLNVSFRGTEAFKNVYATTKYKSVDDSSVSGTLDSRTLSPLKAEVVAIEDEFGVGKSLQITYADGNATMVQHLNAYTQYPYILAQLTLSSNDGSPIGSNYMVAFGTADQTTPFVGAQNRMLWVPYDNDGHGRYENYTLSREITSHEVSLVYDGESRYGMVVGSVDHDKWKSGITLKGSSNKNLTKLVCHSGYTDDYTRDRGTPHGYVRGNNVSSARYMIGFFDDWRIGMETFADACVTITPRAQWDGGNPMGWSSWGVMQNYVNYNAVFETATFIKDELYDLGFHDNYDQSVISIDSFGEDNIGSSNLAKLGKRVFGEGTYQDAGQTKQGLNMRMGLYGGIVIWDWALDGKVAGTGLGGEPSYKWSDCALKVNGDYHRLFADGRYLAIDPTHPAVRANLEYTFKKWSENYNIKYAKMDFINAAACEGDSWYDPEITTGTMAYNYGMSMVKELAEQYGMYVVEGMAPLFPYQYAHGRRTCCDRFSELGESEYVMNAISWAWWTDRLYTVNDPDQLVMCKAGYGGQETWGENRARATSGMCTGAFIFGDNFSDKCVYTSDVSGHAKGDVVGYPDKSKQRALTVMGNADINQYVRENLGSFRPIEGNNMTSSQQAERKFFKETDLYYYIAVFNWGKYVPLNGSVTFERAGIDPADVGEIKELWSGQIITPTDDGISYSVLGGDVCVFRITKKNPSSIDDVIADEPSADGAPVYYNLQGIRVGNNYSGICIKITGNKAEKVYLK